MFFTKVSIKCTYEVKQKTVKCGASTCKLIHLPSTAHFLHLIVSIFNLIPAGVVVAKVLQMPVVPSCSGNI